MGEIADLSEFPCAEGSCSRHQEHILCLPPLARGQALQVEFARLVSAYKFCLSRTQIHSWRPRSYPLMARGSEPGFGGDLQNQINLRHNLGVSTFVRISGSLLAGLVAGILGVTGWT